MSAIRWARGCLLLLLLPTTACTDACAPELPPIPDPGGSSGGGSSRRPFVADWDRVWSAPAAGFHMLSIGGRLVRDNFANRGDIEVRYVEGGEQIEVEIQRFTVASSFEDALDAFARMSVWAYDLPIPEHPREELDPRRCEVAGSGVCYIRAYYDGLFQPLRDGANLRVTIPRGWDGELALETTDNLEEDGYPDRSDVRVDGLAGDLSVVMDSGRLAARLDPDIDHYAGCADSESCTEPTRIVAETRAGAAANMTVDVADADGWYSVLLYNLSLGCEATIDCDAFTSCTLDPDFEQASGAAVAEINYPGDPAELGAGISIELISDTCASTAYAESPEDHGDPREEVRGDLELCVGCL